MAWQRVVYNRLYYTINGGTEQQLDGTRLAPMCGDSVSELDTYGGTAHDYTYSGNRNTAPERYNAVAALAGGIGIDWKSIYDSMANGQDVLIYRESGNSDFAFVMRKDTSRAGFNCGAKWFNDISIDNTCIFRITQTVSDGYYPDSIPQTVVNMSWIFNGSRFSLYYTAIYSHTNVNYYMMSTVASSSVISNILVYLLIGNVPPSPSGDPYSEGGTSETGGGEGSFDDVSDGVTMPGVPSLNLSVNGFVTAYAPTLAQINALATFVWSDWLSGGPTLPKIFANPEDAIISLHMLPFEPSTSSAVEVTVGNYGSGVYMDPMSQQFYTVNCGELEIEEYWGNYLDYNPYTKLTLFLPYVGEITLNPDEVMTHVITIKYRVDAMTGAFVAFILRDDDKILGEYQGNCSLQVPISSANYAQLHSALLGLAGSAVSLAVGAAGSGISGLLSGGSGVLTSAAGMMDSKIRHSHSGALGSASGFMGSQSPYLIIERARQCLPDGLNRFAGYPSQITETLGDLSGFTSVSEIVLDGIPLTDEELAELREILKGGVYL